jgi:hypothetical protein
MYRESERDVRDFFVSKLKLREEFVESKLHLTVYHSRRKLPGLASYIERATVEVEPEYWRFMAMAPGGENPRPDIDVARKRVGIRVQRKSPAYREILNPRSRFYPLEAPVVSGRRPPTGERKSAFGARAYQPHVALLRAGSGIDPDLSRAGELFRSCVPTVHFDRLVVRCLTALSIAG